MSDVRDKKEVKIILKDLEGQKDKSPSKEKPILDWTAVELKAYIKKETKGMNIPKKIKFAGELDKRIKDARFEAKKKKNS